LDVAGELDHGVVVVMFPDAGYKYLSDEALWKPTGEKNDVQRA
jgi:hypothetical protein